MLKSGTGKLLEGHTSGNPAIIKAVQMMKAGRGQVALKILREVSAQSAVLDGRGAGEAGLLKDEAIYLIGLIYEGLGFYPEALGNYARISVRRDGGGVFYRKAMLRTAFVNLMKTVEGGDIALLEETSDRFYGVYRESSDPAEWEEALAGYAVTLYESGDHADAEDVFRKIDGYIYLHPAYGFSRAENYLRAGEIEKAKDAFQRLSAQYGEGGLLQYIFLRLGDIAVMEGKEKDGELFYKRLTEDVKETEDGKEKKTFASPLPGDAPVMGKMALSELYMNEKRAESVNILKDMMSMPLPSEVRDAALVYLVNLSRAEGLYRDTLAFSKEFLSRPGPGKAEVKAVLDDTLYLIISGAHERKDYTGVMEVYYGNREFIKDKRILFMAAESFLNAGLADEAAAIYGRLMNPQGGLVGRRGRQGRLDGWGDAGASIGLARCRIMKGDGAGAADALRAVRPSDRPGRLDSPQGGLVGRKEQALLADAFRLLGDLHLRKGEYGEALSAYSEALKGMDKPEIYLKKAHAHVLRGEEERAVDIYLDVIKRLSIKDGWSAVKDAATMGAKAFLGLGDAYYSMKRWKDSLDSYGRGIGGADADKEEKIRVRYRMGEANFFTGNVEEAVSAWQEVVKEDRDGYMGRLADERLKEVDLWQPYKQQANQPSTTASQPARM